MQGVHLDQFMFELSPEAANTMSSNNTASTLWQFSK